MSLAKQVVDRPLPLKPFVIRLRDGYLVGLGMEPSKGSPCAKCAELWLTQRNVFAKQIDVSELPLRRELLAELMMENNAHAYYEINADGTATRMDCFVFPHPNCQCSKINYVPPADLDQRKNFAFSPLFQIKCARYTTPNGNIWLTSASGDSPLSGKRASVYTAAREREASRMQALEEWLKKSAMNDLVHRQSEGETFVAEDLRSGKGEILHRIPFASGMPDCLGAGESREEAILNAMYTFSRARTLRKYATTAKNPMLIVGEVNWLRTKVPFFLLQQYDLHLLFYPNSTPSWVVGVVALSRVKADAAPIFVFGCNSDVNLALDEALLRMVEHCRPADWQSEEEAELSEVESQKNVRLNMWWTHWIYRCPKISLKDVLHLEAYPRTLEVWRSYFADGQESLSITPINSPLLPNKIRYLVKLNIPEVKSASNVRNVNGIGTWSSFRDSLG